MNIKSKLAMLAAFATIGITFAAAVTAVPPAFADANLLHANAVAPVANTNQDHMEACKEYHPAQECATGEGNNGEFTSSIAHQVNGP